MTNYEVTVSTGSRAFAGTKNKVHIKVIGTDGSSDRTELTRSLPIADFHKGAAYFAMKPGRKTILKILRLLVSTFNVLCPTSLGKIVMIEVDIKPFFKIRTGSWFPTKVEVKTPKGQIYCFPVYHWIRDHDVYVFREGTAVRVFEDSHQGLAARKKELCLRREQFCWDVYKDGIPHCIKVVSLFSLPDDVKFSLTKMAQFIETAGLSELKLLPLTCIHKSWPNIDVLDGIFCSSGTAIAEYVQLHWKEDAFFGYQFLNGVNPMMIRQCSVLPAKFPVTDMMFSLPGGSSLAEEIKKGNIFLCDYKNLVGVKTNTINGKKQYLAAPLVLLHKTPDNKMMPIAIQLKQKPAKDNPIFLPTDSDTDWLTAKTFVRSADFNEHQLNVHLLRTHLLAEVFAMSLMRNIPMVHPLYKLLVPHTRYTFEINYLARQQLISKAGVFTKYVSSGGEGMLSILKRSLSSLTYSSLCIPDDIAERGLYTVPNFYYREDGLRLWDIIHRFVQGVLGFYYKRDAEVGNDSELQKWIEAIFKEGFLSKESTGIPRKLSTVDELVKFVTMVIFTCSAQHAAVNSGQYDYGGWMPNTPISLKRPPPSSKGTTSDSTFLKTLPDVNVTVHGMATMWLLSKQSSDFVRFGHFPEDHFCEMVPCNLIKTFQEELGVLSAAIKARNESLDIPYTYLDPELFENSVSL